MSFVRVKPSNWVVNEKLTSSQMNQLDIDHSNAIDKTGDTVSSAIVFSPGGSVDIAGGSMSVTSGSLVSVTDGVISVSGGTSTLALVGGATLNVDAASTLSAGGTSTLNIVQIFGTTTTNDQVTINGLSPLTINSPAEFYSGVTVDAGPTIIGGSVDITGVVAIDGAFVFQPGNVMSITNGSVISVLGGITFAGGSTENHVSGATTNFSAGSSLNLSGTTTISDSVKLLLLASRSAPRAVSPSKCPINTTSGIFDTNGEYNTTTDIIQASSSGGTILFSIPIECPNNSTLTQVDAVFQNLSGSANTLAATIVIKKRLVGTASSSVIATNSISTPLNVGAIATLTVNTSEPIFQNSTAYWAEVTAMITSSQVGFLNGMVDCTVSEYTEW